MIEAAAQPTDFTADFTVKVTGLRTTTLGKQTNVVKEVEWVMIGKEKGQTFELPQTTQLPDPTSKLFIPITSLTETEVQTWIENTDTRILGIKAHIQLVLDKEVAKANLEVTKMPWAVEEPVVEPEAEASTI
jgi:hypothetical protein